MVSNADAGLFLSDLFQNMSHEDYQYLVQLANQQQKSVDQVAIDLLSEAVADRRGLLANNWTPL